MKIIPKIFLLFAAISIFLPASLIHAETRVTERYLRGDAIWDKSGSPYIVEDGLTIPTGASLTINAGAEVVNDPNLSTISEIFVDGGRLEVNGNGQSRVSIKGLYDVFALGGEVIVKNADVQTTFGLSFSNSRAYIATSTVFGGSDGITVKGGNVFVWGSKIHDNQRGVSVMSTAPPMLVVNNETETGGIGNAVDIGQSPTLEITNSSIFNNADYALSNMSTSTVEATDNWWGGADGPKNFGVNKISSLVNYIPWLATEPPLDPGQIETVCCSSVLFLPGIEGSYMYRLEPLPLGLGSVTNTLWPPNRNDDARKLFLDRNGSSTDPSAYSGNPIAKAYGLYDVYGKFMTFLGNLADNGIVNEWKSFAYDWRKPIAEVVAGPEKKATTSDYLIKDVEDIASRSKTGKVTLIAHSNGGLVAKYLVKVLDSMGKSDLIDSVISVAVPYMGTPQAIASLLHGDGQSIAYGLFLKKSVARELGQNMASAYSLLPSGEYFSKISGPTIVLASTSIAGLNDGSYPPDIQSLKDQTAFVTDQNNARKDPDPSLTSMPIKGNSFLADAANVLHSILDPYVWPANIARWAILGWNNNTAKRINYYTKTECKQTPSLPSCQTFLEHTASTTIMGDGTVMAKSAAYESGRAVSLDLKTVSNSEGANVNHVNILEASTTEKIVNHALFNRQDDSFCQKISSIPGASCGEPDYSKDTPDSNLVISTHSPVELHVYDEKGNHTGIIVPPSEVEDDVMIFTESKIPGSKFDIQDDGKDGSDSYATLSDDGRKYSVVVQGVGVGTFTLDVERKKGDAVLDRVEYTDLPVTPFTVATTTIVVAPLVNTAFSNLASSSKPLNIDVDGNGVSDIEATSSGSGAVTSFRTIAYLEALKKSITALYLNKIKTANLVRKIDRLQSLVQKGRLKKAHDFAEKLDRRIGHKNLKGLSDGDRRQIMDMIEILISKFE